MIPASSTPELDLSACAREPIRTPGSIQPHGFLLTLSGSMEVLQASANLGDWTGVPARAAVGGALAGVIGDAAALRLAPELTDKLGERPYYVGTVTAANGRHFDVLAHRWDGVTIVEFEPTERAAAADFRHLYSLIGDFLQKVNGAESVESLAQLACHHVRSVTGFGRVMVYQFDADGHGHVMAEAKQDGYASYMGQHFPASDIPAQARQLYTLSPIRLIQDANYTPAPLVPAMNPLTGKPNDLSFAGLRSVSPVHLQYMRNMKTLASMSVSLMVKGKLWGLISCHNEAPTPVPFEQRTACEQLGQLLALCIESREDARELQFRLDLRRIMVSMLAGLTQGSDFIENLASVFPELLRFARATGRRGGGRRARADLRRHTRRTGHRRPGRLAVRCSTTATCTTPTSCPRPGPGAAGMHRATPAACWRCRSRASTSITCCGSVPSSCTRSNGPATRTTRPCRRAPPARRSSCRRARSFAAWREDHPRHQRALAWRRDRTGAGIPHRAAGHRRSNAPSRWPNWPRSWAAPTRNSKRSRIRCRTTCARRCATSSALPTC